MALGLETVCVLAAACAERIPTALIILGGAHDLSDNLERLSGGRAEYVRVATRRWLEFAGDGGENPGP